jgi:uncharacterized protein YqeY
MNKLNDEILTDLKSAMKGKKALDLNVLRMLLTAIKNKKISLGGGGKDDLNDDQLIEIVKSEIKKRKDSIVAYREGNREDLALNEENEIKILEKYMPEQISEDELKKIIEEALEPLGELSPKDFGRAMGVVMAKVGNKADGNTVSRILKEILVK